MNSGPMNSIAPAENNMIKDKLVNLEMAEVSIQRVCSNAQRELTRIMKMRLEAERYQKETAARANSQAQLLVLQARLESKKAIAELRSRYVELLEKETTEFRNKYDELLQKEISWFRERINTELQKEIAKSVQKLSEESEKVLMDIRTIRIAAHEELQAQRKITDVCRINALSFPSLEEEEQNAAKEAVASTIQEA